MEASMVGWLEAWKYRRIDVSMDYRLVKLSNGWNVWVNRLIGKLRLNGWIGVWINEWNFGLTDGCIRIWPRSFSKCMESAWSFISWNWSDCVEREIHTLECNFKRDLIKKLSILGKKLIEIFCLKFWAASSGIFKNSLLKNDLRGQIPIFA